MSQLASPLTLPSGTTLANRLAKSAMSEILADPETHAPNDQLVRLYERWGKSGAGLLITGHVIVDPVGLGEPGNVMIVDDRHRVALARWASAAQAHGAQLWMQINHTGRQAPKRLTHHPVAPSPVALKGMTGLFARPRALEDREITALVTRFATTAAAAKDAGFAGVQIHAAHGYLISQFLSPLTNLRDDAWGGDAIRRSRFLLEIVRAVRAAVGPAFPVGVKLNSADFQRGGFAIDAAMDVVRALETAGIDLLEVSGGNYESPAMAGSGELAKNQRVSSRYREAYFLDYARQLRTITKLPILLTGGMRSRAVMEDALASGATDVIGLARPMAHTPELPAKLLDGSLAAAPVVKLRSRIRLVDDAIQVMWYQQQITALSLGRDPDPALGIWTAFWRGLRDNILPGKRRPAATPAAALAEKAG
ncbi:MAG TPA: NADH:flavin oxidoreductase/NADH oxidase family protein [Kofleriaceae bacterium]|jgi:2,4-dienoyl-CoA reductase-like NADH-dependent reductase (Old Yellow Enzyme family)|nr:NADH:flavin oxidoreductase/NADH oxidase family protein [Kofleriaceae bacterium]